MSFETGLFALLQTVVPNVYAVFTPEGAVYPCLSYQVIGSKQNYTLDNAVLIERRVQIDAWADSYIAAKTNADALETLLSGFTGTLPTGTLVKLCEKTTEQDLWEDQSRLFRVMSEFVFIY